MSTQAAGTDAVGINDSGQIVGPFFPAAGGVSGYSYNVETQQFTNISFPGAENETSPSGIDYAGTVVGTAFFRDQANQFFPVGFELSNHRYQKVVPRGFSASYLNGISNGISAVGCAWSGYACQGDFFFIDGEFQSVKLRSTFIAYGVNSSNAVVGVYPHAGTQEGFLYENGNAQELSFPGSTWTDAFGINDLGEVVGEFSDTAEIIHGFTWMPPPADAKK